MNNFPRTFNNEKTVNLIKRRFCETASQAGIDVPTYVVASTNPDFWDFRRMVQSMIYLKFTRGAWTRVNLGYPDSVHDRK